MLGINTTAPFMQISQFLSVEYLQNGVVGAICLTKTAAIHSN